MKSLTFKWLIISGSGLIVLLLSMACLWRFTVNSQEDQKVAVVDVQSLLLSQLKGNATQSDAELALHMKRLHAHIHQVAQQLSQETGTLILTKDSLLSEAQDWTEVVKKRLEQRS